MLLRKKQIKFQIIPFVFEFKPILILFNILSEVFCSLTKQYIYALNYLRQSGINVTEPKFRKRVSPSVVN